MVQQQVKVVTLGDLAEHIARGRADQSIQAGPALPLLAGLLNLGCQCLMRLLATLVIGLLRPQFGALLLVAGHALAQFQQSLLEGFGRGVHGHVGHVLLQALFAFLQQHAALFDGFFRALQALAQCCDLRILHGQQAIQPGVIQLRVLAAPLRDLALQLLAFGNQRLLLLAVGLQLAGQLHGLRAQFLQALGGVGVQGAGLVQRGVHVLLPGFGSGVFTEQFAEGGLGLLALLVQGGKLLLQLLQALHAGLVLVAQLVELRLPGLLFFQFVLALFQLLQALDDLLVQGQEGIGRVFVECLQGLFGQHTGQVVQALLQLLLVVGQGLVLLFEVALGLLLSVLGGLQLLVEAGSIALQREQRALAFLVLRNFRLQALQLAGQPGATGLVILRGQGRPQAVRLNLRHQRLQLIAQLLLLLLEVLELGVDHAQLGAQLYQLGVEGVDLLLRGSFFSLVMAAQAVQQCVRLVERVFGTAADWARFAIAQLVAQCLHAGGARQALPLQQLAGEVERLFGRLQLGLRRGALADQLLALLHGLLLAFTNAVQLLAQFQFAAVQARHFFNGALLLAVVLQHATEQVDLLGQGLGFGLGFAQLHIGLAGLGLQAGQLFAALGQAAANQHHLFELRQVGVPRTGQACQVLAVGKGTVDLRQLLQAALLVGLQLLQLLLAIGDVLFSLLAAAALRGQRFVQAR